jgi:hypothetical protein
MHPKLEPGGVVYTTPFSSVTLSTAAVSDLFVLTAPSNSRVAIREIRLGQFSEFGDAQAEVLSLSIMTGSTSGGGGTTLTPRNVAAYTGALTASSSVTGPSTTPASTASAVLRLADSWNVAAGWWYKPDLRERLVLGLNQRLVLRLNSVPADPITLNGTLVFQEGVLGGAAA